MGGMLTPVANFLILLRWKIIKLKLNAGTWTLQVKCFAYFNKPFKLIIVSHKSLSHASLPFALLGHLLQL